MKKMNSDYQLEVNLKAFGTEIWRKYGVRPTMTQLRRIHAAKNAANPAEAFASEIRKLLAK